jgi:hypothetical protein
MRWAGHVVCIGVKWNVNRVLAGKSERKRSTGRSTHSRKENINMDLRKIRWDNTDWISLAQDRD